MGHFVGKGQYTFHVLLMIYCCNNVHIFETHVAHSGPTRALISIIVLELCFGSNFCNVFLLGWLSCLTCLHWCLNASLLRGQLVHSSNGPLWIWRASFFAAMDTGKLPAVIPPLPMTFQEIQNYLCAKFPFLKTEEGWNPMPSIMLKPWKALKYQ